MDLIKALSVSAAGMVVQGIRLRVVAENLANQDSTGSSPGAEPYRRKVISFRSRVDASVGAAMPEVRAIAPDQGQLPLRYDPSHPGANAEGYVKLPNVNSFVEMMDMREAQRNYDANLNVLQATRGMLMRTIEMLK
jgi:flagellar basal-body rod protein FlgC